MVSIVKCGNYNRENVEGAILKAVEPLGGFSSFVNKGDRVFIKPNLLAGAPPEKAVTTHPEIVGSVVGFVIDAGGIPVVSDSPGGLVNKNAYLKQLKTNGIYEVLERVSREKGIEVELDISGEYETLPYPEGKVIRSIPVITAFSKADKVINLCKMKTHAMMMYTGAVKNMFGLVAGRNKAEFHLRFTDYNVFANMLIDIFCFASPVLNIMDAVVAMEGLGPSNGKPRHTGLLLASENAFEMDLAAASIMGLGAEEVFTVKEAFKRKLAPIDPKEIHYPVLKPEDIRIRKFEKPWARKFINGWFGNPLRLIQPRPAIKNKVCRKCGVCIRNCPPEAMKMNEGRVEIDKRKCISCMCCQELCEFGAIDVKRKLVSDLLKKQTVKKNEGNR